LKGRTVNKKTIDSPFYVVVILHRNIYKEEFSMGYDYDQTHSKIMDSALAHFMEKGFLGASIRQICRDAGVTNGAFYAHFDSKEDLFSQIVKPTLEGMKELYNNENSNYMDIKSADDIKRTLEQTFSSNRLLIHFVFKHSDIFKLLINSGAGTEYEDFVQKFSDEEANNTEEFLKLCGPFVKNTERISNGLIKNISHFVVSSVFDGFNSGKSEEEVIRDAEISSEFCLAGIKHFLDI